MASYWGKKVDEESMHMRSQPRWKALPQVYHLKGSKMPGYGFNPLQINRRGYMRDLLLLVTAFSAAYLFFSSRQPPQSQCSLPIPETTAISTEVDALGSAELESALESTPTSDIGVLGMFYGPSVPPIYQRTLANQRAYNDRHGYKTLMLREKLLPGLWSKPAFMLSTIITEMQKPEKERLKWLFWLDSDIIIMNPNIPLETYLPPTEILDNVNFIVANDEKGLNVGTFFVRVNAWSANLFGEALGLPKLRPDIPLRFSDQSAVEWLLKEDRYRNETLYVPQRWFNAYIGRRGDEAELKKATPNGVKEGDLLIHFAGKAERAKSRLELYMGIAESHSPVWEKPLEDTHLPKELKAYWKQEQKRRARGDLSGP